MNSTAQADSEILVDGPTEGVMTLTLNRPQVKNAFSNSLLGRLRTLFVDADKDDDVRCILITGGPDVFCRRFRHQPAARPAHVWRHRRRTL